MRIDRLFQLLIVYSSVLLLGCANQLAKPIDEKIEQNPVLAAVKTNIENYQNRRVRWGGVIASVSNEEQNTLIEIVSRPLDYRGRPVNSDETYGRFLARLHGFLDPVVYAKGRDITLVGTIIGMEKRLIDSYHYDYVTIQADTYKLWKVVEDRPRYYYDPYWPWYPYYPYYPWPYYYR